MARVSRPLRFAAAAAAGILFYTFAFRGPAVRAGGLDVVQLAPGTIVQLAGGTAVHMATPPFLEVGKRYAFTWPGGGPPQTFVVKSIRHDGWILVDVADENTNPALYVPGEFPTRWLHVALAVSIQEMRPINP